MKHIIIYSHGFGTRADDMGLFSSVAEVFPESQNILFDYNQISEDGNTLTIALLSEQTKKFRDVAQRAFDENKDAVIDCIAHSQGCIAPAIVSLPFFRKVIFLAPSRDSDVDRMISYFKQRKGTEINIDGVSKLSRSDGTVTLVPAGFWRERKEIEPIPLYNSLAQNTDLTIIVAKQDQVLKNDKVSGLSENIKQFELDGNHNFSGEDRSGLVNFLRECLKLN